MLKVVVIADDFTGALDTAVQFVQQGIATQVFINSHFDRTEVNKETEVLVIDTESRPLAKEEAYQEVQKVAKWAMDEGVKIIYKKTDSALRGNVGMELQAITDLAGDMPLYFIPAYPEIKRITKEGIHYIGTEKISESVFGKDPYEPVRHSFIPDIIKEQSEVETKCISPKEDLPTQKSEIVICDVLTVADMDSRVSSLMSNQKLMFVGGCASLANAIARLGIFKRKEKKEPQRTTGLYVGCGSLNEITKKQVLYATERGFKRINLKAKQKFEINYYKTEEGKNFLEKIVQYCKKEHRIIVDSFNEEKEECNNKMEHRENIAKAHGQIVKKIVESKVDFTILMTGGDTLMGYMKLINCSQLEPICELEQGVVVSNIKVKGKNQQVISKSGGFGTEDVFCRIANKIIKEEKNNEER
ncbi:MAG TPA: four-carbon acid sugar kinase family protein [Candidatus Dorea intestinavium]|nr:four-carbon acid sugar kinase family protein [Candidatus Dorea intestinavium]